MNVTTEEIKKLLEIKKEAKHTGQIIVSINKGEIIHITEKSDFNPSTFRDRLNADKKKVLFVRKKAEKEAENASSTE